MYIYMHVYVYICIHIYMYTYTYICRFREHQRNNPIMNVCTYTCMYVHMYCIHSIHVYTYLSFWRDFQACKDPHIYACMCMYIHIHRHIYICVCIYICLYICTYLYSVCMTNMRKHTCRFRAYKAHIKAHKGKCT